MGMARLGSRCRAAAARNRKITRYHQGQGEEQREFYVVDRILDRHRGIVENVHGKPSRQLSLKWVARFLTSRATSTVLVRAGAERQDDGAAIEYQAATLLFSTLVIDRPDVPQRTGWPSR